MAICVFHLDNFLDMDIIRPGSVNVDTFQMDEKYLDPTNKMLLQEHDQIQQCCKK